MVWLNAQVMVAEQLPLLVVFVLRTGFLRIEFEKSSGPNQHFEMMRALYSAHFTRRIGFLQPSSRGVEEPDAVQLGNDNAYAQYH